MPASQQELDELDLKLRSLRTQLRKAEENSNLLAKQKKELEEKIKKNTNDVSCFQLCSILCILVFCIGTVELNLVSFLLVRLSTEHIAVQSINVDKTLEAIYPKVNVISLFPLIKWSLDFSCVAWQNNDLHKYVI